MLTYGKGNLRFTDAAGWIARFEEYDSAWTKHLYDTREVSDDVSLIDKAKLYLSLYTYCDVSGFDETGHFTAYITESYGEDDWDEAAPFLEGILSLGNEDGEYWRDVFKNGERTHYNARLIWVDAAKIEGEEKMTVTEYNDSIDPFDR